MAHRSGEVCLAIGRDHLICLLPKTGGFKDIQFRSSAGVGTEILSRLTGIGIILTTAGQHQKHQQFDPLFHRAQYSCPVKMTRFFQKLSRASYSQP